MKTLCKCLLVSLAVAAVIYWLGRRDEEWAKAAEACRICDE